VNAVEPNRGNAGESSGVQDINIRNYQSYSIATNSKSNVTTYGGGLAVNYLFGKGIEGYANYTYAKLSKTDGDDNLIPGFNTPEHKFNIGLKGNRVWQGLGFNLNFSWTDSYTWRSPFTDRAARIHGVDDQTVPSYHTLDLQINYKVNSIFSTFRVGGSNIYNNKHIEVLGGPEIGALYYASWTFRFNNL
jgi:outer membrane receptor protein involved in Fe transport